MCNKVRNTVSQAAAEGGNYIYKNMILRIVLMLKGKKPYKREHRVNWCTDCSYDCKMFYF